MLRVDELLLDQDGKASCYGFDTKWEDGDDPRKFVSDGVFMQYTGLKDVNGKEVYEGDIVKCSIVIELEVTLVVALVRFEKLFPGFALDHRDGIDLILDSSVEVIGNVYENPELVSSNA